MAHRALVWLLDAGALADDTLAAWVDWLDLSERQRLGRFVRPERRRQFLAGRMLARHALGAVLDAPARDVRLEQRSGAAPVLVAPADCRSGFSISHSGRWVACAASASSKLGLDIERIDAARDIDALAGQAFDDARRAWLAGRPEASRVRDFFDLWSGMEAEFKLGAVPGSQFCLSTPMLSIVLCCEQELAGQPELELKTILA